MAFIETSRSFEGSETSGNHFGRLIKDGVRTMTFREEKNKTGNYVFLLPPYKQDRGGNGVWYKVIKVRKDFGIDVKESFCHREGDPISYFANQCKLHFPNYAKVETITLDNGKAQKKYPTFGRITNSCIYNSAYVNELQLGAHVLVVPEHYVGQTIELWGKSRDAKGNLKPMLNERKNAIAVKIQLRGKEVQGNPWLIEIDGSQGWVLPDELSDSDYLYNLDDVLHYPENDYLIEKLRSITPTDIFNHCMSGYFKNDSAPVSMAESVRPAADYHPELAPVQAAAPTIAPAYPPRQQQLAPSLAPALAPALAPTIAPTIAPAAMPRATIQQEVPKAIVDHVSNPSNAPVSANDIHAFLRKKV